MISKKIKAFTLVELIVVITILAILSSIAFVSYWAYVRDAKNAKIKFHSWELLQVIWIKLNRWWTIDDIIWTDRTSINWVNTSYTIWSWSHTIANTKYKVGIPNYINLKIKNDVNYSVSNNITYENNDIERDFIISYVATANQLYFEIWWEIWNWAGKNIFLVSWTYFPQSSTDAKWLISESWSTIWLNNSKTLTWSLY